MTQDELLDAVNCYACKENDVGETPEETIAGLMRAAEECELLADSIRYGLRPTT